MRKSRAEALATRERIVEAAAARFRENGIAGTGLSDLMAAAGLTHGGFYKHFSSKDQVVAEACASAIKQITAGIGDAPDAEAVRAMIARYLTAAHRDDPGSGCLLAALGPELARSGADVRNAANAGMERLLHVLAASAEPGAPAAQARHGALVMLSTMVGAMILSRLANETSSEQILAAARTHVLGRPAPAQTDGR